MFNLAIDSKLRGCDVVAIRSKTLRPTVTQLIERWCVKERPGYPFDLN